MGWGEGVRIAGWGCVLESEPKGFADGCDMGDMQGESCHARLQVSGLSTWVDGGAFCQDPEMTGGGTEIGGKYQDFAPEG